MVDGPQVKELRVKLWRAHLGIRDSPRPHLSRSSLDVTDVIKCFDQSCGDGEDERDARSRQFLI